MTTPPSAAAAAGGFPRAPTSRTREFHPLSRTPAAPLDRTGLSSTAAAAKRL
jgi:hypothetical protein